MKKFISGFIIGAMIFSMLGVWAAVSYTAKPLDYKVMVNGQEFTSDPPPLEVEGRTYLPLRAMGDALGVPVNWNEELRRAEVGDKSYYPEEETMVNYATYAESDYIIDFGAYCNAEPMYKSEGDTIIYVYNFDTIEYVTEYMEAMIENGYQIMASDDGPLYSYLLKNISDTGSDDLVVSFGQPDVSSLEMYVTITILK